MRAPHLLWSNVVIAAAASACTMRTLILIGVDVTNAQSVVFSLGIGGAAWLTYTWQRHVKSTRIQGLRPDHLAWHKKHWRTLKKTGWFAANLAIAPLVLTFLELESGALNADLNVLFGLVLAFATALLYAGLPGEKGKRFALRRIPGMKMIWVGLSWTVITAAWPAWWSGALSSLSTTEWATILSERFFVITALTLPFDLRDRQWDPPSMQNWTLRLGQRGTRLMAMSFLILAGACLRFWGPNAHGMAMVSLLPMGILVLSARENHSEQHFGWLDGLLVLDGLWMWVWVWAC